MARIHIIGADTPPARLDTLRILCARKNLGRQRVVRIGGGRLDETGLGKVTTLSAPLGIGRFGASSLRRVIPKSDLSTYPADPPLRRSRAQAAHGYPAPCPAGCGAEMQSSSRPPPETWCAGFQGPAPPIYPHWVKHHALDRFWHHAIYGDL